MDTNRMQVGVVNNICGSPINDLEDQFLICNKYVIVKYLLDCLLQLFLSSIPVKIW